ncbi:Receptor-interacting serine/threonine-protein kinase 3 [Sorochytrium milnesiophthora]
MDAMFGAALDPELDKQLSHELFANHDLAQDDQKAAQEDGKKQKKDKLPFWKRVNRTVDKVLTHPVTEVAKAGLRFVPGLGIYVIGAERLTRWKLTYTANESMVATLEKRMADVTITLLAVIELLPPQERIESNPRLQIFQRRTVQLRRVINLIERQIAEYGTKSEKEKLGTAEIIQSSFSSLSRVVGELERDIAMNLQIQAVAGQQAQNQKLDNVVKVLVAQRSALETMNEKNDRLLSLMTRQIESNEHALAKMERTLIDKMTPGYAKVENVEIQEVWWDFFRWPVTRDAAEFVSQMPVYFEMKKDMVARRVWISMARGDILNVEDLGLPADGLISPQRLNDVFPTDPVYNVTIGDWLVWKSLGWLFLAMEIERRLLPLEKKFIVCAAITRKFVRFLGSTLTELRKVHQYDSLTHARLLDISGKIASSSLPPFSDRFSAFIESLSEAYEHLDAAYKRAARSWAAETDFAYELQQQLAAAQYSLAQAADDLGVPCELWDADEIEQLMQADLAMTAEAHQWGQLYANSVWQAWNGQSALISPHALSNPEKLGKRTVKMQYMYQPVVLRPLAFSAASAQGRANNAPDASAKFTEAGAASTFNVCKYVLSTYGVSLYNDVWMCVTEYAEQGDLATYLSHNDRLSLVDRLHLMLQITRAVAFCHQLDRPHGKLTSSHVYLAEGLCVKVGGLLPSGEDADILRYRAPETFDQTTAESAGDWKANDLYALGHILLEVLTGYKPHPDVPDNVQQITDAIRSFDVKEAVKRAPLATAINALPVNVVDFVVSALSSDELERPTSAEQFHSELEAIHARLQQQQQQQPQSPSTGKASSHRQPPPYSTSDNGRLADQKIAYDTLARQQQYMQQLDAIVADINTPGANLRKIEQQLQQLAPNEPRALLHLANLYYFDNSRNGFPHDFSKALDLYKQAAARNVLAAKIGLADCYYFGHGASSATRQPAIARDLYDDVLRHVQSGTGNSTASENVVDAVHQARAHAGLGDVLYDLGEYNTALEHYFQATSLDPACKRAWARIGDAHLFGRGTGVNMDQARKCYQQAKGTRRHIDGMVEYYKLRGEPGFLNMYLNDEAAYYYDH